MKEEITFEISIPSDNDGYILLQCEHCGGYFKVTSGDINDEQLLNLYCPECGLVSENYLTEEVIGVAQLLAHNYALDFVYSTLKNIESKTKNKGFQIKVGNKPKPENINTIRSGIDTLKIVKFECCQRSAKIKPLLIMTGCNCPFCGVKEYDIKSI